MRIVGNLGLGFRESSPQRGYLNSWDGVKTDRQKGKILGTKQEEASICVAKRQNN